MALKDILMEREGKDLYLIARRRKLPLPGVTDQEDAEKLYILYNKEEKERDQYINEAKDPVELTPPPKRLSKEEREAREQWEQYHAQRRHLGELLIEIERRKKEYAELLSPVLLEREVTRMFLRTIREEESNVLDEILSGKYEKDTDGFFMLSVSPEENERFTTFENAGYALIRKTDWRDEEDERIHFTGIKISEDVLSAFREAQTDCLRENRKIFNAIYNCCSVVGNYYGVAPFSQIRRLYQQLRKAEPDQYPDLSDKQFEQLIIACSEEERFYWEVFTYRGLMYVTNIFEDQEPTDETDEGDSYVVDLIIKQQRCGYDFYLPSDMEIRDNDQYGFSTDKKCFLDLQQFIREAYLDEKYLDDMRSNMFRMMSFDPEDDWGKKTYSMDRVEQNTEEFMSDLIMSLKDGYGPVQTFKDQKDFYVTFREDAKEKFQQLLIMCHDELNEPWFLGHTNREVREQGFDEPWDLEAEEDNEGY